MDHPAVVTVHDVVVEEGHPWIVMERVHGESRGLVHEAAHNWLNDALALHRNHLSEGALFPSPWKQTLRPAFGFLHACWTFSLVTLYTHAAVPRSDPPAAPFLRDFLPAQHHHLTAAAERLPEVTALLPSSLCGRVDEVMSLARSCRPRHDDL